MHRIFILSPAKTSGQRASLLHNREADFDLARRLRGGGVSLGEVFSFLSGLYFRGRPGSSRGAGVTRFSAVKLSCQRPSDT